MDSLTVRIWLTDVELYQGWQRWVVCWGNFLVLGSLDFRECWVWRREVAQQCGAGEGNPGPGFGALQSQLHRVPYGSQFWSFWGPGCVLSGSQLLPLLVFLHLQSQVPLICYPGPKFALASSFLHIVWFNISFKTSSCFASCGILGQSDFRCLAQRFHLEVRIHSIMLQIHKGHTPHGLMLTRQSKACCS